MSNIKKVLVFKILFIIITCFTVSTAYANDSRAQELFDALTSSYFTNQDVQFQQLDDFSITSGLNREADRTFDSERTIKGNAPKDTVVNISVYSFDDVRQELYTSGTYEATVGASGMFSQSIQLSLGENYIIIAARKDAACAISSAVIKRKNAEIKNDLQNGIFLPGQLTIGKEPEQEPGQFTDSNR